MCVYVCMCVRVCMCECVCVLCLWIHAANLLVVGLIMHHKGLILCGVANGSSPGPCHMVETRQGQGALELAL